MTSSSPVTSAVRLVRLTPTSVTGAPVPSSSRVAFVAPSGERTAVSLPRGAVSGPLLLATACTPATGFVLMACGADVSAAKRRTRRR